MILSLLDAGLSGWLVRRSLSHREKVTDPYMREFHRPLQTIVGRQALLHFARCLDPRDLVALEPELRKLPIPVSVVWGTAERYLPPATRERLVATFPGCTLRNVEGAGHMVPVDEPQKLSEALLEGFLAPAARSSPTGM